MFNYENLSDYEFEILCCDIVSRKLGTRLRTFATGKDGGIDATDNASTHNIVVQAKHYLKSSYADLYRSLCREVKKVKKLNPNKYYICCAQKLTPNNITDIYNLFDEYMTDSNNVIDLSVIDTFLNEPENYDILRKHFKLWLESTEILNQVNNRNIFIDCESFMADIQEQNKFFVETCYYNESKIVLEKNRLLFLLGQPGVGKTVTTKMLALYYAAQGYSVRYTTDGEISNLKKSITESEDQKEIIILDDCLGQAYFKMKESQENELIALIRYVSHHKNKKMIMNSRITIYNEAKEHSIVFANLLEDMDGIISCLDMKSLSIEDKGRIFFNHLYFMDVPKEYYINIINEKAYKKIVMHKNYCPRIIEYTTKRKQLCSIKADDYAQYLLECLDKPCEVWKNEYDYRMKQEDRLLLTTLFSLTDTIVANDVLKRAYNERIKCVTGIDVTQSYYENALKRLNGSMIRLVDRENQKWIGAVNPSVNDFLREKLSNNYIEFEDIRVHCTEYIQVKRLFPEYIKELVECGRAGKLHYSSSQEKYAVILSAICRNQVYSEACKDIIYEYLENIIPFKIEGNASYLEVICRLLTDGLKEFYLIKHKLEDNALISLFGRLDIDEFGEMLNLLSLYEIKLTDNVEQQMINEANRAILDYCKNVQGEVYYEDYDIRELIEESCLQSRDVFGYCNNGTPYVDQEYEIDYSSAYQIVRSYILDDIKEEIKNKFEAISCRYKDKLMLEPQDSVFEIDLSSLESYIDAQFEPVEPDYDYEPSYSGRQWGGDVLECIFREGAF